MLRFKVEFLNKILIKPFNLDYWLIFFIFADNKHKDMEEFEVSDASKKTKTIYISTIFSIALVLLMLGMLGLILVHAKNLSNYVKENIVLNIIIDEGAKETDVLAFQKELNGNPA